MTQPRPRGDGPRSGLIRCVGTLLWVFASMASAWSATTSTSLPTTPPATQAGFTAAWLLAMLAF